MESSLRSFIMSQNIIYALVRVKSENDSVPEKLSQSKFLLCQELLSTASQ